MQREAIRAEFFHPMNRRTFVSLAPGIAAAVTTRSRAAAEKLAKRWTAAAIGHTGRGNFGHGLDIVFAHRPDVQVVAIADPDPAGRARAQARAQASRAYADYREMLERERPQLVSVAPRHTDQHHAMVSAALAVGAHVYCEKPFTRTLAEADELLAQASRVNRRIAVAHQGRLAPDTLALKRRLEDGALGELLEIRVHGKQDRRAGGEDMVVLGTHQFDLVRYFVGSDAEWCAARVLHQGREIGRQDIRAATENIGPVAGDEIEAMFAFPKGVNVHYTSRAKNAAAAGPWGMELIGTRGRARLLNDPRTTVTLSREGGAWAPLGEPSAPVTSPSDTLEPNRWVVDDWQAAITANREAACSGHAAMKSLEMIHAVFAAGLSRGRIALPLGRRSHPLE